MSSLALDNAPSAAGSGRNDPAEGFVSQLTTVVSEMSESAEQHNWQLLGRLAHHLKEAGEMSGFDDLSPFAARLERAAIDNGTQMDIRVALDDLISQCRKVRSGCAL